MLMQELGKSKERERNFEQILFTAYQFFANNMANRPLMHQNQQYGYQALGPQARNNELYIAEEDEPLPGRYQRGRFVPKVSEEAPETPAMAAKNTP